MCKGSNLNHLHVGTENGENWGYSHLVGKKDLGDISTLWVGHSLCFDNSTTLKPNHTKYLLLYLDNFSINKTYYDH